MNCTMQTQQTSELHHLKNLSKVFKLNRLCCTTDRRSLELCEVPTCLKWSTISQETRLANDAAGMRLLYNFEHLNSFVTCTDPVFWSSVVKIIIPSIFKSMTLSTLYAIIPGVKTYYKFTSCNPPTNNNFTWPICQTSEVCRWHDPDSGAWWTQISCQS